MEHEIEAGSQTVDIPGSDTHLPSLAHPEPQGKGGLIVPCVFCVSVVGDPATETQETQSTADLKLTT